MGFPRSSAGRQGRREHPACHLHDIGKGEFERLIHVGHVSLVGKVSFAHLFITSIRSTSNTRIERLWVEVGRHFARLWRGFFTRLERNHKLNRKDPEHIWTLQFLFMGEIQRDCDEFRKDWNSHPLSGRGHNRSPLVCF